MEQIQNILSQAAIAMATVVMTAISFYVKTLFANEKQRAANSAKQYALGMLDTIADKAVGWANQTIVNKLKEKSPKLTDDQIRVIQGNVFGYIEKVLPEDAKAQLGDLRTILPMVVESALERRKNDIRLPQIA